MKILFGPVPHQEASDFIADKPVVSREVFAAMLPEVRARVFLISGLVPFDIAQKARDRIADLPQGADWADVKRDLVDSLSPFFPPTGETEEERQASADAAQRRAELLLRTHGYQAYSAAQYNVLQRQKDVFPAWRYQTAQDDRVREAHAALEGVVVPANDPFWQTHFPPWDFNCRCTVVPLSEADLAEIKQEDQAKPADARSILSDTQLSRMETDGTLLRGPNTVVDVRSPRQKRDGDGYAWQPGDLRIPLATLRERYSPEVFGAFKTWAKGASVPETNKTVWSWLGGDAEWPDLTDLSLVKKLGGSTGAELVADDEGRRFVRKFGASPAHLASEVAADQAYAALGINVPKVKLYDREGRPVKLAQFIQGRSLGDVLKTATPAEAEAVLGQVRRHFVADALLANYDVAGLDLDNILVDKAGQVWRIDNGGALKFRAQGRLKDSFGPEVSELRTMRDPKVNPAAARVFSGVTEADIRAQTEELLAKRAELLKALPADVRDIVSQRLDHLAEQAKPKGGELFAEAVKKSRIVGKVAKWDRRDIEDTQVLFWTEKTAEDATITRAKMKLTEQGSAKIMERIAASLPKAPPAAAQDNYWSSILAAAKTINQHAGDGAYNSGTLATLQKTKAALEALAAKGANAAGMKQHYLGIIEQLEAAKAGKQATGKFEAWKLVPEKTAGGKKEFSVTRTSVDYTAKQTRRGHARGSKQSIYSHDAYVVELDGTKVRFVPFREADGATDFKAPYALRGYLEVFQTGEASAVAIDSIAQNLATIGLDTAAASEGYGEIVYLRKGMQVRTDVFTPAKLGTADAIVADAKLTDPEKIAKLKTMVKDELGLALPDTPRPGYDWRGQGNAFDEGWVRTERWDLPRAQVEKDMKGWALHHHSSTSTETLVDSILNGGGDFTATTERLRKGIPITSGMSPTADLDTGGANYLFTRIHSPTKVGRETGLNFKIGNLARQDAFSFNSDRFGNVKDAEAYRVRGKTVADFKSYAKAARNETIFKWGVSLLDEIESIVVASESERSAVLGVFKTHGWEKLPDGRAVADIVQLRKSK